MEYVAAGIVVLTVLVARASRQTTAVLLSSLLYFQIAGVTELAVTIYVGLLVLLIGAKLVGWASI